MLQDLVPKCIQCCLKKIVCLAAAFVFSSNYEDSLIRSKRKLLSKLHHCQFLLALPLSLPPKAKLLPEVDPCGSDRSFALESWSKYLPFLIRFFCYFRINSELKPFEPKQFLLRGPQNQDGKEVDTKIRSMLAILTFPLYRF